MNTTHDAEGWIEGHPPNTRDYVFNNKRGKWRRHLGGPLMDGDAVSRSFAMTDSAGAARGMTMMDQHVSDASLLHAVLGDADISGKSDAEKRRMACSKRFGTAMTDGKSDAFISGLFNCLRASFTTAGAAAPKMTDAEAGIQAAREAVAGPRMSGEQPGEYERRVHDRLLADNARDAWVDQIGNAWKGPAQGGGVNDGALSYEDRAQRRLQDASLTPAEQAYREQCDTMSNAWKGDR